ncbi:MAG: hypothetical protein OXP71_01775 [Candidatus Poribacteria bacterium]|nr:hypothetical protein [Candidatus Poribacteria bacterium]
MAKRSQIYSNHSRFLKIYRANHNARALHAVERTEEEQDIYLRGFDDVLVFAKTHFPDVFTVKCGPHASPILNCIPAGDRGRRANIIAPRGCGKSTYIAVIYVLHCVYYKEEYERRGLMPDSFILIVSGTEELATDRLRDIRIKIEDHPPFRHLKGQANWSADLLETANGVRILPVGRRGRIRGQLKDLARPTLIILDDVENGEEIQNPKIRDKNWKWFNEDVMPAGRIDGKTNFIHIDTVKHEEAISKRLQLLPDWYTKFYRAIENPVELRHPAAEPLWEAWEKIYTDMTLEKDERDRRAHAFLETHKGEMLDGVQELWPEMLSYLQIRRLICNEGYISVMRERQNSMRDPSKEIFNMESAIRFKITPDGILRSDGRIVHWSDIAGATVFLDWAGGKDAYDSCFAAAVFVLWVPLPHANMKRRRDPLTALANAHAYVLDVWMDKVPVTAQLEETFKLIKRCVSAVPHIRFDSILLAVEDIPKDTGNAMHDMINRAFEVARKEYQMTSLVRMQYHRRSTRKLDRIAALEPPITNGWIAFNETLSEEFMRQMRQFPTGDFCDGPDALQGAAELPITRFPAERLPNGMLEDSEDDESDPMMNVVRSYL